MHKGMWAGIAFTIVAFVVLVAILIARRTPRDPGADAVLYLERATQAHFRAEGVKRDSQFQEGFPDQYEVTCVRVNDGGSPAAEPLRITVNYDQGLAVRDGGHSWSSDYCRGEAAAFQQAAAAALDRPISAVKLYPRIRFRNREELAAWGPFGADPERAFEVDLVVFGSVETDGPAVATLLQAWLPRWATARKVRILVAFCGDRREAVDEPYKGTGYGWRHNTDALWTIELLGPAIGSVTAPALADATKLRHPAAEAAAEKEGRAQD